VRTKVLVS
jgi:hypothetical protein